MSFIKAVRLEDDDPPPRPVQNVLPPATWQPTAYATAALNAECAQIATAGEGTRNDTLNRAAFNMAQLIAGGQIPEQQVTTALMHAGISAGLEAREITKTIASGLRKGSYRSRTVTPRETGLAAPQEGSSTELAPESRRIDWAALAADEHVQEWLCEPVIPQGALVALYSPPKVGKSLLALDLAIAVSRGTQALGTDCTQADVLYLDYENTRYDVRDRISDMGNPNLTGLEHLHYESFPALPALDTPQGGQELLAMAQACHAGLVIIDTVSRAISGDENDSRPWLDLYRHTLLGLKRAGIAVLRLDHTGKDESKGMRGSSAKLGDVDLVWRMEELVKGNSYLLECEAHRIQMQETRINIERTNNPLTHRVDTRTIGQTKTDAVLAALDEAHLPLDAGRERARQVLNAAGIKVRNDRLADLLRKRQGLPPVPTT